MKHFPLSGTLPLLALVSMTACVDENYDLENIDTTTEIKVKDLILPVKIEPITLSDIISVDDDGTLKPVVIDGQTVYAVNKRGSFESDDIIIPTFSAQAPYVDPITLGFRIGKSAETRATGDLEFSLSGVETTTLKYEATDIDESIRKVVSIGTEPFDITVKFDASSLSNLATVELTDLKLTLPKGLDITSKSPASLQYTPDDGVLTIPSLSLGTTGKNEVYISVAGIKDMDKNGYVIDGNSRSLAIDEQISVSEATLKASLTGNSAVSLDRVSVDMSFNFSNLTAKTFTGEVQYSVNGINIKPVEISDLPDFLAGSETDIVLANPQIYLNLNNPVGEYNLSYQSGISITPIRDYIKGNPLTLDDNAKFVVANGMNPSNICLSPLAVNDVPVDFSNPAPVHYGFSSLSEAIAGEGIPQELLIELVDPEIPVQNVTDFRLGETLDGVTGKWEFLAPLAFKNGTKSTIVYTADGWNDKDVDDINITHLCVMMNVSNTLPVDLTITGYPIDKDGNEIPLSENKSLEVTAGATNQARSLDMKGTIRHLDGIRLKIELGAGNEEALSPDQTITLTDLKAQVSGSYTTDF